MKKPYPPPLSIPQSSPTNHTHTFILLHGRGSNAERFGKEFLQSTNISTTFPTVKFIFPTAKKRRATAFNRTTINQWFDNHSLADPNSRTDIQIEGLCETAQFLRELVEDEARLLGEGGYGRVILGGLSQGCAAGMFTFLGGGFGDDGLQVLAGFVGMSGWLPFEAQMRGLCVQNGSAVDSDERSWGLDGSMDRLNLEGDISFDRDEQKGIVSDTESESGDDIDESSSESSEDENCPFSTSEPVDNYRFDPFAQESSVGIETLEDSEPPAIQALNHIRDILDLPPLLVSAPECENKEDSTKVLPDHLQVPVFLGHGSEDPKVAVHLGEKMFDLLSTQLHMDITWKVYEGFGHWYKVPDEIDDIIYFLKEKVGVPVV